MNCSHLLELPPEQAGQVSSTLTVDMSFRRLTRVSCWLGVARRPDRRVVRLAIHGLREGRLLLGSIRYKLELGPDM